MRNETDDCEPDRSPPPSDERMAELAEAQAGMVSLDQLRAADFGEGAIRHRLRRKRLHLVLPKVYAVGHGYLNHQRRLWAGVLYGGEGSLLADRTAAAVWELLATTPSKVHVVNASRRRSAGFVQMHRSSTIHPSDRATHGGLPVTSVARTALDVAATASDRTVERLLEQAEYHRLFDLRAFESVLARNNGHRGTGRLSAGLAVLTAFPTLTRSEAEELFLEVVRRSGLPRPRVNQVVEGFEVDFCWPRHRLVVEIDGDRGHAAAHRRDRDHRRDAALQLAGWLVLRITHRRLVRHPQAAVDEVAQALVRTLPLAPTG